MGRLPSIGLEISRNDVAKSSIRRCLAARSFGWCSDAFSEGALRGQMRYQAKVEFKNGADRRTESWEVLRIGQ